MITKTIAFTLAAVWVSALGSVSALAYTLNRPLVAHSTLQQAVGWSSATIARVAEEAPAALPPEPEVVELATMVVRARAPVARVATVRDLRCGQWQPMTQGSTDQWVRTCE